MNITILGAGAFGSALGRILKSKNHQITFYDPKLKLSLTTALANAELIVLAIPSIALEDIVPKLPKNLPLIIATKGILTPELFQDFNDIMVLSGPGFATDLDRKVKTKLTTTDPRVRNLFKTDWLTFDLTQDERGVLLCGALKNIYAIYAGLKNLKPKTPAHDTYLKTAAEEMKIVLFENGAEPKTVNLACGKDDLKITCGYPSRNYEFGQKLIKDPEYQPEKTVEGLTALKLIQRGALKIPRTAFILKSLIEEVL